LSLAQLFGILFAVNLLTIGGGYVMLPMLHGIFVERYALLTNREFTDALALGQLTPGPLTIMNTFIGYKLMGFAGAAAATLGTYLPSLIVVTLVTKYYVAFKDSRAVAGFISGVKPAVAGMLAAVAATLGGEYIQGPPGAFITLASFALMSFTKIEPTLVLVGAGAAGALFL